MEPGVYFNVPNETYHAGPGLSCSQVKRLRRSPLHLRRYQSRPPTPAMFNGTLTHCALLETAEFDKRYAVAPYVSKNSAVWKLFAEECLATGRTPITVDQRIAAFEQAASLRGLDDVSALLSDGRPEVTAYWLDEQTGVLCKCRPDFVSEVAFGTGVVLLDVKTAVDASKEGFAKACAMYGYHLQADWYCTGYARASGLQVFGMVFAVVENEYPYAAASYMLGDKSLARAAKVNRDALERFQKCEAANSWPGYPRDITVIDVPAWG